MSIKKTANATLKEPVLSINDWEKMHGRNSFGVKSASLRKFAADSTKYMLSHCTIMASVMTEEDPQDYLIKPECSHLVNNNDDAWTNEVLKKSYRSFVGAFNFVEHFQNSHYAKGHILDSVLRKIQIAPPDVWVYFCDILVATDITHDKLVNDIREGEVRYLSMGCVTDLVICSFCGQHVTDANNYCHCLEFQKGTFLADDDGVMRRVAELCGHKSLPNGGVKFVEASWVGTPAFPGAANRGIVEGGEEWVGPKTPYTHKAASTGSFAKAASAGHHDSDYQNLRLSEALLKADLRGRLK